MSDLGERLKKLGLQKAVSLPPKKQSKKKPLVEILGAKELTSSFGNVLLLENLFPYGSLHGDVLLNLEKDYTEFQKIAKMGTLSADLQSHLFIDTETTGLSGGTGTIPFLIGFGYFDESGFRLEQLMLENPVNEPAQLAEFSRSAAKFKSTITFNGKSFDLPLMRTRFILNKIPDPLIEFSHIDLLHLSRRIWRSRLSDRSLKELERQILHYTRNSEEVPGWMIPQIYFDFLKSGDGTLLKNVAYHNAIDIVSMAALYIKINLMLMETQEVRKIEWLDLFSIGQMYEQINDMGKALNIYLECFYSNKFSGNDLVNLIKHLAVIYRKEEKMNIAATYWEKSAQLGDIESCIALAKYNEHSQKNNLDALQWVYRAEELLISSSIPGYRKRNLAKELLTRKQRLERMGNHV
jgi:uncharacterized protein YprB with RNaseH-like and TPR domain